MVIYMTVLKLDDVVNYVEENIKNFHQNRLINLQTLTLKKILQRKNPYLFRAKNIINGIDLVKVLLDAHLSSQEETIFGNWLEGLAIFINNKVYEGWKSGITGIDLEFNNDNKRYIVTIKSGPNWGNSSQIEKMVMEFDKARRTIKTSDSKVEVVAINGCCYGKDSSPFKKGNYYKFCGQDFWSFISGVDNLYIDIIEPLGFKAKQHEDEFIIAYAAIVSNFTINFLNDFCINGMIDWGKLIQFNSGSN